MVLVISHVPISGCQSLHCRYGQTSIQSQTEVFELWVCSCFSWLFYLAFSVCPAEFESNRYKCIVSMEQLKIKHRPLSEN